MESRKRSGTKRFLFSSCSQMCCSNSRWLCMIIALYRAMPEQFWSKTQSISTLHPGHFGFAASLSVPAQCKSRCPFI